MAHVNQLKTLHFISTWADGIVARVFEHKTLTTLGEFSSVPVVISLRTYITHAKLGLIS